MLHTLYVILDFTLWLLGAVVVFVSLVAGIDHLFPHLKPYLLEDGRKKLWTWWRIATGNKKKLFQDYATRIIDQPDIPFVDPFVVYREQRRGQMLGEFERAKATEVVSKYRQCTVIGPGGYGKSALVHHLEVQWAKQTKDRDDDGPWPLRLHPREICARGLSAAIQEHFANRGIFVPLALIESYLADARFSFIIDGIGQLTENERSTLSRRLEPELRRSPKSPTVVLTVATEQFERVAERMLILNDLPVVELRELEDCQVEQLVAQRAAQPGEQQEILTFIGDCGKIAKLTRIPLLLDKLLGMEHDERRGCLSSWHAFARRAVERDLDRNVLHQDASPHIKAHHKSSALEQFAARFYLNHEVLPAALEEGELNASINSALESYSIAHQPMALALRDELSASRFLESFEHGRFFGFSNNYLRDYFAAIFFSKSAELLLNNIRSCRDRSATVLRFWCGMAPNPDGILDIIVAEDPVLALTLLSDIQQPTKALVYRAFDGVKQKIQQLSVDPDASESEIRAFEDELFPLCDALAESTRQRPRAAGTLSRIVLDFLLETVRRRDLASPSFLVGIMSLARCYDSEAAAALIECYRSLKEEQHRLQEQEAIFAREASVGLSFGNEAAILQYVIRKGRLPDIDILAQNRAFNAKIAASNATQEFADRLNAFNWRIRREFVALGNSALAPIQEAYRAERGDPTTYIDLLEQIGTDHAQRIIKEIQTEARADEANAQGERLENSSP